MTTRAPELCRASSVAVPRAPARWWIALGLAVGLLASLRGEAVARTPADCKLAWSKAVRSYLTKNRKAAPDGSIPEDMAAMEAAAEQWLEAFQPACEIEAAGDKATARVEAAALGVEILARLDQRGCARFLEYFMESTRPQEICRAAPTAPEGQLREQIQTTIPRRS
jgi:hypothetical protein